DIERVRLGMGSDPRIGYSFLYAGAGYGGSCFPKDVKALLHAAAAQGQALRVLDAVERANDQQKLVLVDKITARFGADLAGRVFALWGLAFKPGTDDMREAPSRVLVQQLLARGARVVAYDPVAMDEARRVFGDNPGIRYADSAAAALQDADALVLITEWREFKSPDFDALRTRLRQPVVFDGRNLFEPALMRAMGLEYHGIGRSAAAQPAGEGAAS
ncbi:UDP-glucose/GDP-mannose dehydrogenase family protein, partial [Azohydromonas lata]|uniref:UDP-glucose/GDP-mannose dehydrogenase family protein n=1 Tax=Azohydromonas lata TaxID=45677 RepID=UPI000AFD1472